MARFAAQDLSKLVSADDTGDKTTSDAAERQGRIAALARTMYCAPTKPALSHFVLEGFVRTIEFALVGFIGFALYFSFVARLRGVEWPALVLIPMMTTAVSITLQMLGLYRLSAFRNLRTYAVRFLLGMGVAYLLAFALSLSAKLDAATVRPFLLFWFIGTAAALLVERVALSAIVAQFARAGRLTRRTVLVGGGKTADDLFKHFADQPPADLAILGFFDDRTDSRSPAIVGGFHKLGSVDDLIEFSRQTRVDLIIFALPITAEQRILQMLRKLWVLPIDIRLAAHMNKLHFAPHSYSYIGSVPLIDIVEKPLADWDLLLKLCFDKIIGSLCLILLSPLMLAVAVAVKVSTKGPILFKQKRYGFNNELIEIYKFRSMYVDRQDFEANKLVTRDDPRVTPVGRFLRKTSLDELPQLFNVVFKGNLSLVGPRPHAVQAKAAERLYDEVVDGYFARHRVRPGITGLAQINGWRGETDTQEKIQKRVEHDLDYIENWSILRDFYILLATPFALLKTNNAY